MKRFNKYFLTITFILMLCFLCSCGLKKSSKYINNSIDKIKIVTTNYTIKDGDVLVYEYNKVVKLDKNNANVVTTISSLDDNFTLSKNETEENISDFDRKSLVNYNIDKAKKNSFKSNVLSLTFNSDTIKSLYGIECNTDIVIKIVFKNKKIANTYFDFVTSTNKTVSVKVDYEY